jgi:glycosyltransferase involved in cell wall biosynthesis
VIHWVIPDFMPGSGGHATIFRMVRYLEEFGHENKIWITFSSRHGDGVQVRNLIREHFAEIEAEVGILRPESLDQIRGDVIFATEWRTAYFVRGVKGVSSKMYFVQDYEPYFFPVGTRHLLADATYDFNLHCVCLGSWLKEKVKRRKIASVEAIDFGYDTNCYRFSNSTRRKENVIACYCRTATERRVSELCLIAFSTLRERGRDFHVNLFGDSDLRGNFPFSHANLGVLSPEELGILYQECTLGVVFSATNVSLIPLEMMACGLPVIELDVEGTRYAFPKEVVSLAKPDPEAIADAVEWLLDDKEARSTQSDQALAYARETSWEENARKLESAVRKTLSVKGVNR